MSSESSNTSAVTERRNESRQRPFRALRSHLSEDLARIAATSSRPITRVALEQSASPRNDLDSLLVAELVMLPPGDRLYEAWQQGPEALYAFLNARWVGAMKRLEPKSQQIRLDRDPDRMRLLADMRNEDA